MHGGGGVVAAARPAVIAFLGLILLVTADDGPLGLADLGAYPAALRPASNPPIPSSFRDLWDQPDAHRGRFVQVQGRLARRFQRPAVGDLPGLSEWWIQSPSGEAICAVGPSGVDRSKLGDVVRFDGYFLRRIRYTARDGDRLAPLVVGPGSPAATIVPSRTVGDAVDWGVGVGLAALVAAMLASRHLGRPSRRPIIDPTPPRFIDEVPAG